MSCVSSKKSSAATEWHATPSDVLEAIYRLEAAVADLQKVASGAGIDRKFTLDGRLVGDIGELIVARHYEIIEREKPKGHAHDLYAIVNGTKIGVQVKLRRESNSGFEIKYQPDILVVLQFKRDWSCWREVYHGPGSVVVGNGVTADEKGRLHRNNETINVEFTLEQLRQKCPLDGQYRLTPKIKPEP